MEKIITAIKSGAMLAPLAGFTDFAFRSICKKFGAGIVVSEMISAKGLYYKDKKTKTLLDFNEMQRPFGIQIFGSDPRIMAIAADMVLIYKPDFIDINMGCPTPKIVRNGDGSALLKNPSLVYEVTKAVVDAATCPVSVKIRTGWDENSINAPEIAKIIESAGASFITVHGRTTKQMYAPPADYITIKNVVEAVNIPVIGNGDITSFEVAKKLLTTTGCAGVMIGRGAIGNPFVFKEYKDKLSGKLYTEPTTDDKINTAIEHLELMVESVNSKIAILQARPHLTAYIKGFKDCNKHKVSINLAKTKEEMIEILNTIRENENKDR